MASTPDSIVGTFFKPLAFGMAGADFVAITQFIGNAKASNEAMYEMIVALPLLVLAGAIFEIQIRSFKPRKVVTLLGFTALTVGWIGSFWGIGTIFAGFHKGFGTAFTVASWLSVLLCSVAFILASKKAPSA